LMEHEEVTHSVLWCSLLHVSVSLMSSMFLPFRRIACTKRALSSPSRHHRHHRT
jgi:hypothetical protein